MPLEIRWRRKRRPGSEAERRLGKLVETPTIGSQTSGTTLSSNSGGFLSEEGQPVRRRRTDPVDFIVFAALLGLVWAATNFWKAPGPLRDKIEGTSTITRAPSGSSYSSEAPSNSARGPAGSSSVAKSRPEKVERGPAEDPQSSSVRADVVNPDVGAKVISMATASYTPQARAAQFHGKIYVTVSIAPDGTPRDIQFPAPVPFDLEDPAVDAVRRSRFAPATHNGQPVESRTVIEVPFR